MIAGKNNEIVDRIGNNLESRCALYYKSFLSFSVLANFYFENQKWHEQKQANLKRMHLIRNSLQESLTYLQCELPGAHDDIQSLWELVKEKFLLKPSKVPIPIRVSYLLSLQRNLFSQLEVEEFPGSEHQLLFPTSSSTETITVIGRSPYTEFIENLLDSLEFPADKNLKKYNVQFLREEFFKISGHREIVVELFPNLFYRNQHAYLIGLIKQGDKNIPLAIPFIHWDEGIKADAFLTDEDVIIQIFEFTRSYILVNTKDPEGLIGFLHEVIPKKDIGQLIINLGFQEWGKAIIQLLFQKHLERSDQHLQVAPGIRGMVMIVFTLPDYPLVFKVIREDIHIQKSVSREDVLNKYQFVAEHDRVGRLADAQLFEYWRFPKDKFDDGILTELSKVDSKYVTIQDKDVIVRQIFTERKMIPLNLYIREQNEQNIQSAILDYGKAIKELAISNLFPGDLLLKNFGVTEDKRVVFYDYDEVAPLTSCNFLKLPTHQYHEEMWDNEVWTVVHENDIFPEELEKFLIPKGPYRHLFRKIHGEIFNPEFWNKWKAFHEDDGIIDLQPY